MERAEIMEIIENFRRAADTARSVASAGEDLKKLTVEELEEIQRSVTYARLTVVELFEATYISVSKVEKPRD